MLGDLYKHRIQSFPNKMDAVVGGDDYGDERGIQYTCQNLFRPNQFSHLDIC